jgi:hypothetical protein
LVGAFSGCGGINSSSQTKDLNPGPDSNIGVPGWDKTIDETLVEEITVLPNTYVPKGVNVYLFGKSTDSFNNWRFVIDLYKEIHEINVSENLEPTIGKPTITRDDLYNQEITLIVMFNKGRRADYDLLVKTIDATLSIEDPNYNGKLSLAPMETDKPDGEDLWIQDFGEFASAKITGLADPVYLVVDTFRNENRDVYSPEVYRDLLGIPLVKLGMDTGNSAQYGGNIEVTPNGIVYIGDSVDDPTYSAANLPSPLYDIFVEKGNPDAIKIESDWLAVGHVDEYMTYIPSNKACDSTLVWGSTLMALKVILEEASNAEYQMFAEELATVPIGRDKTGKNIAIETLLTKADLITALNYFRKDGGAAPGVSANLDDYDFTKATKAITGLSDVEYLPFDTVMGVIRKTDSFAKFYIYRNLYAERSVQESVKKVMDVATCKQVEMIPQAFLPNFYVDGVKNFGLWSKDSAHLPGMTNALVLRNHVIFPDPWVSRLREMVSNTLSPHLGSPETIHFVDDAIYHFNLGEVHCATNVVREMDMPFTY